VQGEVDLFREYLEKFMYYFIPFAEELLRYLRENVFPYLTEIMLYLQDFSEKLPNSFEAYVMIFILLVVLGIIANWKFEKREEKEKKKKEKSKEISELLFGVS